MGNLLGPRAPPSDVHWGPPTPVILNVPGGAERAGGPRRPGPRSSLVDLDLGHVHLHVRLRGGRLPEAPSRGEDGRVHEEEVRALRPAGRLPDGRTVELDGHDAARQLDAVGVVALREIDP